MANKSQYIKTTEQIKIMRENGKLLAKMLNTLKSMIIPGINTMELEKEFIKMCQKNNATPACKGYAPYGMPLFPTGLCISKNNECVHCYPKLSKTLNYGDVVTVDTSIEKDGLFVDSAFSMVVLAPKNFKNISTKNIDPKIVEKRQNLVKAAEEAMFSAIKEVKPGVYLGDVSNKMHETTKSYGFNVIRDYAGHGIGTKMHEWPEIPCYGKKGTGPTLDEGMTICIEALVCEGNPAIINTSDWETAMRDGKDWVQSEHTVLVTKDGYELITAR